ncbi:thioredoxin domain-containing protein 9-like [Branchiostoma floridae]|uniref:Thioredoxin domain-containing protein 9 n=1 Tax=Branchiostoma floridae TaxID=7739 RepID=C3XWI5_BRAFL|nr:thioredoxin domain-containing protein 9-like [Branchiostoma floridae]|eukprot:XP_002611709.1 hypothetical protein BRAFLDRAFT_117075 [Branchiostoma floridae]
MDVGKIVEQQVIQAAQAVEEQIDAEMNRLDNMDEDDLERIKQKRLAVLKKQASKKQELLQMGHGQYTEIPEEKEFFPVCQKSPRVVCHFYRESTFRCKIVDKHLAILAPKHVGTRFCKIDAEKCKWLCERLKVRVLPTICLVIDGKTKDFVVGFDDLGGVDDFPTEMMEWRLGLSGVIDCDADPTNPPTLGQKPKGVRGKKSIRGGAGDSDDDSDDD